MRALWRRPGTPFATPEQFAAILADRARLAEAFERQGETTLADNFWRNNAAMEAWARSLDAQHEQPDCERRHPGRFRSSGHHGRRARRQGR
jgi:hypothetical protein